MMSFFYQTSKRKKKRKRKKVWLALGPKGSALQESIPVSFAKVIWSIAFFSPGWDTKYNLVCFGPGIFLCFRNN